MPVEKTRELNVESNRQSILKSRAARLAHSPELEQNDMDSIDVLVFKLNSDTYAIDIKYLKEAIITKTVTSLPDTPSFVLGIANVRGEVQSVVDIKKFFGMPGSDETSVEKKVIIVSAGTVEVGLSADDIIGVRPFNMNSMNSALSGLPEGAREYLIGVSPERVELLNVERLLSDPAFTIGGKSYAGT